MKFTLVEQLAEVEREIALRQRVYARMVDSKQMKPTESEFHLERMQAVAHTLRTLIAQSWGTI